MKKNIKIKMQEWFAEGYAEYLNKKEDNDTSLNDLKEQLLESNNYSILDNNIDSSKPTINVEKMSEYPKVPPMTEDIKQTQLDIYNEELKNYMKEDNNKFKCTLTSQFTHDSINKNIKSTFSISIPEYNTSYYIGNEVLTLKENVLWTKALIADKDIIVTGNDVNVNGDIYAYGNPDKSIKERGIIVGEKGEQGNLTVNGNIITGSYLQTKSNNSNITVNDGEVYCNALVIPKEQESCNITINGNVNTFDDIELNGTKSNVNINGNYYGFTYGATGHNESSSIIINSDDIGNGSSIRITGDGKPKDYYGNTDEERKGTFIAGTVYIDLDVDYQTGESVSVKGNYRGYSETLDSGAYAKDKVEFGYFSPLYLMDNVKDSSAPTYKQRGEYLKAVHDNDNSILNLGNRSIDIQNIKYSLGDYIKKENNTSNLEAGIDTIDYISAFDNNLREYNYYVNKMGDTQIDLNKAFKEHTLVDGKLSIGSRFNFNQNINKNIDNKEIFL